jgi:hypothetical protein
LFIVVANAAEMRGPEIALAKLRGYSAIRTVAFGMLEPIALITLALPVALLGGALTVRAISAGLLAADTPVVVRWPPVLALLAGYAGAVAAVSFAALRVLRRPVVEQWRRTARPKAHARPLVIAEAALFALAVVGLIQLRQAGTLSTGNTRPLALLGPGLLIVVVTTLAVRLLSAPMQALVRITRASPRVASFLALRQVVRRPGGLSLAGLLAIALALAVFSIEASAVSRANQHDRARTSIGAPTVVRVSSSDGDEVTRVVHRVDPDGRWAMAAAEWLPSGGTLGGRVLAIESRRFSGVGYWRDDFADTDVGTVMDRLEVAPPPPVVVRGDAVRITARTLALGRTPVNLGITFEQHVGLPTPLGRVRAGVHTYTARVSGCTTACTITNLTLEPNFDDTDALRGTLIVRKIEAHTPAGWTTLNAGLSTSGGWVQPAASQYGGSVSTTREGVVYRFDTIGGPPPPLVRNTAPTPFPMAVDPRALHGDDPTVSDGGTPAVPISSIARPFVLPRVGEEASLVELSIIRATLPFFDGSAVYSVWLGADAPPDAIALLQRAGLIVGGTQTTAQRYHELTRTGPALGVLLYTMTSLAGALLAGAATAVSLYVTGRRRLHELAALAVAGARRRTLFSSTVAEIGLLLGMAAIAGAVAGIVTAGLVLPSVPEFPTTEPPQLRYGLHWAPMALLLSAVAVLVVSAASLAAGALVRAAHPSLLREPAP